MSKEEKEPMILEGDCIELMKEFDENTFDAIVTDPPYGLEFMGKKWDKLGQINSGRSRVENEITAISRGPEAYQAGLQAQEWHTQWLTEAYRVLKPGGSMLVMGGTRTFHRLMVAIEDSGFIIKDCLMWLYGSGFPKAQDLGKMIDKREGAERKKVGERLVSNCAKAHKDGYSRIGGKDGYDSGKAISGNIDITIPSTDLAKHWDGFKVGGVKPAYEPIVWAVKPPEGSYIDNVLKWGVGAVNVDECRVGVDSDDPNLRPNQEASPKKQGLVYSEWESRVPSSLHLEQSKGRFPANIMLSHHSECEQVGVKRVKGISGGEGETHRATFGKEQRGKPFHYADSKGLETVESWDCHPDCAIRRLDKQSGGCPAKQGGGNSGFQETGFLSGADKVYGIKRNDSGGASRFFYCAKASRGERNKGLEELEEKLKPSGGHGNNENDPISKAMGSQRKMKNNHPTVKPLKLFEYLIKLVTRKGQIILDPFLGSGTTMIAANNVDRECVGIEREEEYIEIAEKRVEYWLKEKEIKNE